MSMIKTGVTKPATDKETLRLFWQASLQHKRLLLLALLFPVGAICLNTLAPLFAGKILATLGRPELEPTKYLIYFGLVAAVGILCNRIGLVKFLAYQAETMRLLQAQALDALLRRSVGFHNNNVGGKLVSDAIDFPTGFAQLIGAGFAQLLPFSVTLLTGTVVVLIESWQIGVVIVAMASFAIVSGFLESRRRSNIRKRRLVATKALTGHLADTIVNVQTVKTFARESQERKRHGELGGTLLDMRLRDWGHAARLGSNRIIILTIMQLLFIYVVIRTVQADPSLLGIGIFAFSFTIMLASRLFEINTMLRSVEDGLLLASPMTEILQEKPEITDRPGATTLKLTRGGIELRNVHFRYQDSNTDQAVFSALNLDIKPGEKVGLVGPSGGGKSTLTRLLLRFEDIDEGEILIDGQDISKVTQSSLRRAISYVPQEPLLFHRPIHENIAYGNPLATDKQMTKAAKAAHADDFIRALPQGYDTVVGERGVKLSGGQRQRIAIARAILKDSPILLLDEATSALDSESEVFIQDALWKLMEKRTAIVIAHRLSTIQKMDRIVVLENGTITEQGTHKELLTRKGTYAKLWSHQSGGFIED